jgi:hypothetical protein
MFEIKIKALDNSPKVRLALSEMLVDLLLNFSQKQPHRAEIGKMMMKISYRSKRIAKALILEA